MAEAMEIHVPVSPASQQEIEIIRNPLLLKKISKHLPAGTLLHLRETCFDWNKIFLPEIKKRHRPIELIPESQNSDRNPSKSLAEYTQVIQNSKQTPFTKYSIARLHEITEQQLVDFFTKCGPAMTCLKFGSDTMDRISRILYEWTPELVDLKLDRIRICREGIPRQPPTPLPRLKHFQFAHRPGLGNLENFGDAREILEQAGQLQNFEFIMGDSLSGTQFLQDYPNYLRKLKTLTLIGIRLRLEVLQALYEIADHLRLERFVTSVTVSEPEQQNTVFLALFSNFLMTQAGYLRQLEIKININLPKKQQDGDQIQIPKMETLSSFSLRQSGNFLQFEGQTLGTTFPALKHFEFGKWTLEGGMSLEEMAQFRHEGVTELVWDARFKLDTFRGWFPGVTRLQITVSEADLDELAYLWNKWPALEFLHIKYNGFAGREQLDLDQLLSGVPRSELEKLKLEFAEMDKSEINLDGLCVLQHKYKTWFGIGDQKYLQNFTLKVHDEKSFKFTDIGGYLGLGFAPPTLQFEIRIFLGPDEEKYVEAKVPFASAECLPFIRASLGPFAVINL